MISRTDSSLPSDVDLDAQLTDAEGHALVGELLIVCDPPEDGWQLVAPHCGCEQACDACVTEAVRHG